MKTWILVGQTPIECDFEEWVAKPSHVLWQVEVGEYMVSTVFLGIDHGFTHRGDDVPLLFETMVFSKDMKNSFEQFCYRSYLEAEEGHRLTVLGCASRQ